MEARAFGLVAVFALLIGFAAVLHYNEEIDTLSREYDGVKASLDSLGKTMALQQAVIDQKEAALNELEGLMAKVAPLEKALVEVRKSTATLIDEVAAQEVAFDEAVANVRQAGSGVSIGSMVLTSGKVLTDVKVKSVRADYMSVTHGLGTARLLKSDLPFEIVDRFKLEDPAPFVPKAKPLADAVNGDPSGNGAPPPAVKMDTTAARAKMKEIQGQIALLRAQFTIASGSYTQLQRRADDYRDMHAAARAAGRSSSHLLQANSYQASADLMQKQLTVAQAKIEFLHEQMFSLRSDLE